MTPAKLFKHHHRSLDSDQPAVEDVTPDQVDGMSQDANLDHYISDLEDLAYRLNQYLSLRDSHDPSSAPADLHASLQRITNQVKNLAVLYTDCVGKHLAAF